MKTIIHARTVDCGRRGHGRGAGRPDPATVHPSDHRIGSEVHSDLHLPGPIPSRIGPFAQARGPRTLVRFVSARTRTTLVRAREAEPGGTRTHFSVGASPRNLNGITLLRRFFVSSLWHTVRKASPPTQGVQHARHKDRHPHHSACRTGDNAQQARERRPRDDFANFESG
jgi:hypothetical protein